MVRSKSQPGQSRLESDWAALASPHRPDSCLSVAGQLLAPRISRVLLFIESHIHSEGHTRHQQCRRLTRQLRAEPAATAVGMLKERWHPHIALLRLSLLAFALLPAVPRGTMSSATLQNAPQGAPRHVKDAFHMVRAHQDHQYCSTVDLGMGPPPRGRSSRW